MDNPADEAKKQLDDLRWMLKMWLLLGKLGALDYPPTFDILMQDTMRDN